MSASTAKSSSNSGGSASQSGTHPIDNSIKVFDIPLTERVNVCYFLDQQDLWEEAARKMGYEQTDIIKIKQKSQEKRISPSDILISHWGDQNHTVTELFMLLNSLQQFSAMECIRNFVNKKYHRLILNNQPNLNMLLNMGSLSLDDNKASRKILNGPEVSRETNESETDADSMQATSAVGFDANNINELASTIPQIAYNELVVATDDWNKDHILGRGGFGIVFKGRWKYTEVAIKRIEYHGAADDTKKNAKVQMKQSLNELRYLNSCRHDNILPLYGFSIDGKEPCLVYQFMAGGSLESRLKNVEKPLTFKQRQRIIIGTARGLQYLHTFNIKPLIHGDIKPANILLDPCCIAKIGDFGLVREGSFESMEVSSVYGTRPYLPIEFLARRTLSTKIDTFSYGVVLFELMTGLRAYDKNRGLENAYLTKYMFAICKSSEPIQNFLDKSLNVNDVPLALFENLFKVALICTVENAQQRPEMVDVLNHLEKHIDHESTFA